MQTPNFERLAPEKGSKVLIIGGCGGIGNALVKVCTNLDLEVSVMDLQSSLQAVRLPKNIESIPVDLRDERSVKAAFHKLKSRKVGFDHMVVASGYTSDLVRISELSSETFDDVLNGNLKGVVLAAKEAAQQMSSGSLIFLSTALAQVGAPGYGPYSMAKAGINALTRILASELAPNIRVNGVAPGPVETPFIHGGMGRGVDTLDVSGDPARFDRQRFEAMTPLGRIANPNDIVGPILFLMSDAARFVTGQVLHINGGGFMRD